jgi:hypothetical protein
LFINVVSSKIESQVDEIVSAYTTPVNVVDPTVILESAVQAYLNFTAAHRVFKKDRVMSWCIDNLVDRVILPCLKNVDDANAIGVVDRVVAGIPGAWFSDDAVSCPGWCEGVKGFLVDFVKREGGNEYRTRVSGLLGGIKAYNEASLVDQ